MQEGVNLITGPKEIGADVICFQSRTDNFA